jgi:hypothetical protein
MKAGIETVTAEKRFVYDRDGRPQAMSEYHFGRLLRKLKIFRCLERLEFRSFLDVASGWEHFPWLVTQRYWVPSYYSDLVHMWNLPTDGLEFGKLDHAVTLELPRLPYRDDAFDVVLCSEVFEHLVRPIESVAELLRVAARYVVLTTLEGLSSDRLQRWLSHHRVDVRKPHVERNFLTLAELEALFGGGLHHENLLYVPNAPPDYDDLNDLQRLTAALCRAVADGRHGPGAMGIVVVKSKRGEPPPRPTADKDAELAGWLVAQAAWEERFGEKILAVCEAFRQHPELRPPEPRVDRPVGEGLLALLRCPDCAADLVNCGPGLSCRGCARTFSGEWGVPILYPSEAARPVSEDAILDRLCGDDAHRRRIVRRVRRRLARNERPPGPFRRLAWRAERALGFAPGSASEGS